MEYNLPRTLTVSHMNLSVLADGRHTVPTSLTITAETATQKVTGVRQVALPPIADSSVAGATATVPITFPALTGRRIRITVSGVRLEYTTNYYSSTPIALPLGIAEVGIPGLSVPPDPATVPGDCQMNLLKIDGHPIGVKITGGTATALSGGTLQVSLCGPNAAGVSLGAGPHILQTSLAHVPSTVDCPRTDSCNGWNINQLVLDSAPGGGAAPATAAGTVPPTTPGPAPVVTVRSQTATTEQASVHGADGPFELVLGQSVNAGWQVVAHPAAGAPPGAHRSPSARSELVDGFGNGWAVTAADLAALGAGRGPATFDVTLTWAPQRQEWAALAVSAAAIVACLVVGFLPERWRRALRLRRRRLAHARSGDDDGAAIPVASGPAGDADLPDGVQAVVLEGHPEPELGLPTTPEGRQPAWWAIPLIAVVGGLVAGAISSPLIGLAAGVAIAAALFVPQVRAVTSVVAVGLLVAAGVTVVLGQAHHPVPESADWPSAYESAAVLVWMAVVFLGADGLMTPPRARAARPREARR